MIEVAMTVHVTEAELARDLHGVLAKVKAGAEVVIQEDNRPIAVIRPPRVKGRLISESIALAEARGSTTFPDEGFMKDVEEGIAERSRPWNPPDWE